MTSAIGREKQIKGWLRHKKIKLIESMNPEWKDLSKDWFVNDGLKIASKESVTPTGERILHFIQDDTKNKIRYTKL